MRPALLSSLLATTLLSAVIACGDDDDDSDGSDAVDAGDDDGDDAGDRGDGDPGDDDGEPGDPDGGTSVTLCGGLPGFPCEDTHYCDWSDGSCGAGDGTGVCRPRPETCEPDEREVCGCDGDRHDSACAAAMVGTDVSDATCTSPAAP